MKTLIMIAIVCATSVHCRPADERTQIIPNILEALNLLSPVINNSLPEQSIHLGTEYAPLVYQSVNQPYMQNQPYNEKPYGAPANRPVDARPPYMEKPYTAPANRPYDEKPYTPPANRPYPADVRPPYVEKPYSTPSNRPYSPYVKPPQTMLYSAKPASSYPGSYNNPSYYTTTTRRPLPPIKLVLSLPGIPALEKAPKPKPIPLCPPGQIAKPNILSPNVKQSVPVKRQLNYGGNNYGYTSYAEKEEVKDYICTIIPFYNSNNYDQTYSSAPVYNSPSTTSYATAAPSYQSTAPSTVSYPIKTPDAAAPYNQSNIVALPNPPALVASPSVPTAYSSYADQPTKALNQV